MTSTTPLRIGLLGLDTSHAVAFTELLNDAGHAHHIPGAKVAAAWSGGSPDWPISINRVAGFRDELASKHGVAILDTPEAVAAQVDVVFVNAVDGRVHRDLVQRVLPAGKPVFVDKPFAVNSADARAMVEAAAEAGVPLMSCSSLRYAQTFRGAIEVAGGAGAVQGLDVFGPLRFEAPAPGLFWYGCHGIEMLIAALGPDFKSVRAVADEQAEVFVVTWADGRVGTYRGNKTGHTRFGGVIHGREAAAVFDVSAGTEPFYASMMREILAALPQGRSAVDAKEMIAVVSLIEACNEAREVGR